MKRFTFPVIPVLTGLAAAQILSTCLVYFSNFRLYGNMKGLQEAGWMTVPNYAVMDTLKSLSSAIYGGFFFTLTIGVFLTLVSILIIEIIQTLGSPWRFFSKGLALCTWSGQLVLINLNGINVWASLLILVTPALVVWVHVKMTLPEDRLSIRLIAGHLACLILLAVAAAFWLGSSVFSDFRDDVLFSCPAGLAVNDFYYRYTLYPAQVFKSLEQSQICSVKVTAGISSARLHLLGKTLMHFDYLPVSPRADVADIDISGSWQRLIFSVNGCPAYEIGGRQFIKSPEMVLKAVSQKTDRWESIRNLTLMSLCVVSLLTAYLPLYYLSRLILAFITSNFLCSIMCNLHRALGIRCGSSLGQRPGTARGRYKKDIRWISMLCGLAAGITLIWLWQPEPMKINCEAQIADTLKSEFYLDRIKALKIIAKGKGQVGESAERISLSDSMVERYWLVRALAVDLKTPAYSILIRLMDDSQINVAYRAVYALNERREHNAIPEIFKRIETSAHWYFQYYAYKTLRQLGWKQTASR